MRPPWIIRTYAGFGGAEETNRRFLANLKSGQTGLSVAFDLPTQNGYDPDMSMARGEVGGCGVSIAHAGDLANLFRGIRLDEVNTSMTINATAPFLLGSYLVLAEQAGISWSALRGTVQNDLLKEFVARGTSILNPGISFRLSTDLIAFAAEHVPQWNPINVCGYHYMESGAGPHEEIGYAFANALMILDAVRTKLNPGLFEAAVRRLSFFVNSGIELVPEICKFRAYAKLWPELCEREYGISGVRFRAGCQVRSVSLTAEQPENNIARIVLESLPAILSADARVNALQLPGFREALSLPDQMEQTLSIRVQQILQHETRIGEYNDIFEGSKVIGELTKFTADTARALALELRSIGFESAVGRIDDGLTRSILEHARMMEENKQVVVGVNDFREPVGLSEQLSSPPPTAQDARFEEERMAELTLWRSRRDHVRWEKSSDRLRQAVGNGSDTMSATVEFARAGGTVGEWARILESETGGRYTPRLFLSNAPAVAGTSGGNRKPLRIVLGKTGLDGHNNGIKLLAMACSNAGMEVIYAGTKLPPEALLKAAIEEDADVLAISSLSGAHLHIARQLTMLRKQHPNLKIALGGIIPEHDCAALRSLGVDLVVPNTSAQLTEIINQIQTLASKEP